VKVLSRLVSPAGFGLVLLLFFLLPFVSVSCDVPGVGEAGVSYKGSHLVSGAEPTAMVPGDLKELLGEATGANTDDQPDPDVRLLAIVVAALAAVGVLTVLIPQLKARLFGGAAVAGATLVMTIVTMVVAQSNLETAVLAVAKETGAAETSPGMPTADDLADQMIHTEIGFWLVVVILVVTGVITGGAAVFGERLRATRGGGGATLAGLPFGDPHEPTPGDPHEAPATSEPGEPPAGQQP